jgi:CopG family transcriptional regulator/antitoxin EndoAI
MSRTSSTLSVSLPPEMARILDRVRRSEHRTRSEVVREALRQYLDIDDIRDVKRQTSRLPEAEPTAEETVAIEQGAKELRRGKFVTFEQLRHVLDNRRQQPRSMKSSARPRH